MLVVTSLAHIASMVALPATSTVPCLWVPRTVAVCKTALPQGCCLHAEVRSTPCALASHAYGAVLQELCLGGSLRDKVLKQMTTWNKVRRGLLYKIQNRL